MQNVAERARLAERRGGAASRAVPGFQVGDVLPGGFHRIWHYCPLANGSRRVSLALARELLVATKPQPAASHNEGAGIKPPTFVRRHCARARLIVQTFTRGQSIRAPAQPGQCTVHSTRHDLAGIARWSCRSGGAALLAVNAAITGPQSHRERP